MRAPTPETMARDLALRLVADDPASGPFGRLADHGPRALGAAGREGPPVTRIGTALRSPDVALLVALGAAWARAMDENGLPAGMMPLADENPINANLARFILRKWRTAEAAVLMAGAWAALDTAAQGQAPKEMRPDGLSGAPLRVLAWAEMDGGARWAGTR